MNVVQFHLNYSAEEDRIYIFTHDGEGAEHAFGVTRRLFKLLWPALGNAIQATSEAASKATPPLKKEVLEIEQVGVVSEARESGSLSSGPTPEVRNRLNYLTKTIQIRDNKSGGKVLSLSDGARSMNIDLTHERLIVLCEALKSIVDKNTDWDLNLVYPWEQSADADAAETPAAAAGESTRP